MSSAVTSEIKYWLYLKQQIIDGSLHLQSEAVACIILAKSELVIDAEDRHSRDGCARLGDLLVLLTALQDLELQLLQLCSKIDQQQYHQICFFVIALELSYSHQWYKNMCIM